MKQLTSLAILACTAMICGTACKNDRTDDTRTDTATVTATTVNPSPDTTRMAAGPSAGIAAKDSAAKTTTGGIKKESTVDSRTKKTSRKGRIILASLKPGSLDKMEADKEGIYNRAEIMPAYPGGETALRDYIENHIQYPDNALDNNVEGTVKVYFAVDEQGKIYTPTIISPKLGYGLDEEAIRVVRQMPKWTPGQIKGKNVKTRFTLPITYKID